MARREQSAGAPLTVSLLGNTLPMPRWTLSWMGVLVLAGTTAVIVRHLGIDAQELLWSQETKKQMELAAKEYGRHMWEEPAQTYVSPDGAFMIKTFADHCIAIQRKLEGGYRTRLVPDLAMEANLSSSAARPVATMATLASRAIDAVAPAVEAQGHCQSPHRGSFESWREKQKGCVVKVWRKWPDGCTHYQMLNTCTGAWDSNADGTPRVTWTACRH